MTTDQTTPPLDKMSGKIVEIAIRLSLLAVLLIWCFQILRPFAIPVIWAIIIAVAISPVHNKLVGWLHGRRALAATLISAAFLVLLMVPTVMLTELLVKNITTLAQEIRSGQFVVPPVPETVKDWPLIGDYVAQFWHLATTNLDEALKLVQPQIKALGTWLVEIAAGTGMAIIMFVVAFVIAGVLLAHSTGGKKITHSISRRLVGDRGDDFATLAQATIRSVARGVLGVAVIQALLAGIGFMVAGVPGAGIWALLCLILAVIQIGVGPVVIPAIIYIFATGDTLTAVIFLIWNSGVMVIDNVLKPMLMGRGVDVPMLVIFLGAIGGLLLSGIVGLFTGAIVLALGYKLFQAWLNMEPPRQVASDQ